MDGKSGVGKNGGNMMKSALFVDFDSVYRALATHGEDCARRFATEPLQWLARLADGQGPLAAGPAVRAGDIGESRRFLVRRCYLGGSAEFRDHFARSGFEVVDCPSLAGSADSGIAIQIALDALDLLERRVPIGEFTFMSATADFRPLLFKLRKWDQRTVMVALGEGSAAFVNGSDHVIDRQAFIDHALYPPRQVPTATEPATEPAAVVDHGSAAVADRSEGVPPSAVADGEAVDGEAAAGASAPATGQETSAAGLAAVTEEASAGQATGRSEGVPPPAAAGGEVADGEPAAVASAAATGEEASAAGLAAVTEEASADGATDGSEGFPPSAAADGEVAGGEAAAGASAAATGEEASAAGLAAVTEEASADGATGRSEGVPPSAVADGDATVPSGSEGEWNSLVRGAGEADGAAKVEEEAGREEAAEEEAAEEEAAVAEVEKAEEETGKAEKARDVAEPHAVAWAVDKEPPTQADQVAFGLNGDRIPNVPPGEVINEVAALVRRIIRKAGEPIAPPILAQAIKEDFPRSADWVESAAFESWLAQLDVGAGGLEDA